MSKYEEIINKKYNEIKKELAGVLTKVKGTVSTKSKSVEELFHKAGLLIDDLDLYVKEKWGDINDDLKKSSSRIIKQLHRQKSDLVNWYEKSLGESAVKPYAKEEGLFYNDSKDKKKVHYLINSTLCNMAKISRSPNTVKSLLSQPLAIKKDLAMVVEFLRRSDDDFDNELRKCLFTIESYNELNQKA